MQGTRPCLAFRDRGEEAVKLYTSLIPNSRVLSIQRSDGTGPIPAGALANATFELDGREYAAFDGGPHFSFSEAFSLMVTCDTQEEIDELWERLLEGGGEESQCGWLKDRFGVSWQVVPASLGRMLTDATSGNCARATEAMLQMRKLDVAALERAYGSRS